MGVELTVAIVLFNSADGLSECLRSIRGDVRAGWAEAVAVDNASPDQSVEILSRELPEARLVSLGENRGFAAGANAALAGAHGRYWLLLNPDVRVPANGLQRLIAWMDSHPRHAVASPEIAHFNGGRESPGRALPSITRTVVELMRLHRALPQRVRARVLRGAYWTGGDQLDAGWIPGTAMIVRPEAAKQVGRLNEAMFLYGEDLEWCWRMRRSGWKIGVCSTTVFVHHTSSSARASFGAVETERRVAAGLDTAHRLMYGRRRARVLAAVMALALAVESRSPGRQPAQRLHARRAARIWRLLAGCA